MAQKNVGSNPTAHPNQPSREVSPDGRVSSRACSSMDRAADFESVGWGFESLQARLLSHPNFLNASRILSNARSMFSNELAYERRRYPSPCRPKAVPGNAATPASSSKYAAISAEVLPKDFTLGKA